MKPDVFVTAFTKTRQQSISWARWAQSYFLKLHSNIILLLPGLPSGHFPSSFPTKTLYDLSRIHTTCPPPVSFVLIWSAGLYFVSSTNHAFSPVVCYLVPLRSKYYPQRRTHLTPLMAYCYRPCMYDLLEKAWGLLEARYGRMEGEFSRSGFIFPQAANI